MKSKIKDVWVSENRTEEKWASGFWFVFVEFLRAQGAVLKEVERKKERKLVIGWQERNKRSVIWGTTVVVWCGVPQCCHQFLKLRHMEH